MGKTGNKGKSKMKKIPYANGEVPFCKDRFADQEFPEITIEWLLGFVKELGLPITLRPYQERIVVKTVNHFLQDKMNCILIESATGSGKTVMGLMVCLVLQKLTGAKTSWTTLRRELLRQANETNTDIFLQNVLMKTISMMGKNPDGNDVLVVDEAHKDATSSMAHIHAHVNARFIILLSATPIRSDKATIFYDKIIKDSGIRALIRDKWLSEFDLYSIEEWTPECVAERYLSEMEKWGKTAVFFHKREQCQDFMDILTIAGVDCEMITGDSDREVQLQRFKEGEVQVVVNMMVLTEGFDCPSLETVFVRDSGKGTTVQMAGRVLRLWEVDGELITKNIIQSVETGYPFVKEATPVGKFVWKNDEWKELGHNNVVNKMIKSMLAKKIAHAQREAQRERTLQEHEDAKLLAQG